MFTLAPSLLAADFLNLAQQVSAVVSGGAGVLHIDVMDGHFVRNLSMGPGMVAALRGQASLDVHLMVSDPDFFVTPFAEAGADWISFHVEATVHGHRVCQKIRAAGCKVGIAINPGTPIAALEALVPHADFVLLMSVNPGFGGQAFIPETFVRLAQLQTLLARCNPAAFIQVDGGIGPANIVQLHQAGMTVAVAGSSVFGSPDPALAARNLIQMVEVGHVA